jgi:hypothetical protein
MSTTAQEPTVRELFRAIDTHQQFMGTLVGYDGSLAAGVLEMLAPYRYIGRVRTDRFGVPDAEHLDRTIACECRLLQISIPTFMGMTLSNAAQTLGWESTRPAEQTPAAEPAFPDAEGNPGEPRFGEFLALVSQYHRGDWRAGQAAAEKIREMLAPYRSRAVQLNHEGVPDPIHLHNLVDAACGSQRITHKTFRDLPFSTAIERLGFYLLAPATPAVSTHTFGDLVRLCRDREAQWKSLKQSLGTFGAHYPPSHSLAAIESSIRDLLIPYDVADRLRCDHFGVPGIEVVEELRYVLARMRLEGLENPSEGTWFSVESSHRLTLDEAARLLRWPKKQTEGGA